MKVEQKILAAFGIAFLGIVLGGVITFHEAHQHDDTNQWIVHTYEVIGKISQVQTSMEQIESGGRGYLLTGQKEYLSPYHTGIDSVGTGLDELQSLTADNPIQQGRLEKVRSYVNRAIAFLHDKIAQRDREGGVPSVGTQAKDNIDQVRFACGEMRRAETGLLDSRIADASVSARRAFTSFALLLSLAALLLSGFFVFIWRDLGRRRRDEEALRESDARFRRVLDSAPDAMLITDEAGTIQLVNSQAGTLFGHAREEFAGRRLNDLLVQRAAANDGEDETMPVTREKDAAYIHFKALAAKYDGVRKDGSLFPVETKGSPLEVGKQRLLITAVRDRTEQQQAEDALGKYSLDLARSNAELERFAYVASHDLQEPLRMVSSYTQLLSRRYKGKLDASADEFIAFAVDGANRMQKLINDLLALSRIGTQARPSEPVDTGGILRRVLSDMRPTIEAAGASIVAPEQMPTVLADGTQVGQLFQNLIGNALKFRRDEPPRVEITVQSEGENCWRFSFRDNGIGIEPQYFERIFVIFQRLHGKESYPGTGIGLAICKKIVERLGGHLWVESHPDQGANFLFTLPASP